jgi:hypothetical protein
MLTELFRPMVLKTKAELEKEIFVMNPKEEKKSA